MIEQADPDPDAIAFLARRSPLERHAIARLLDPDGPSLPILRWIVDQPDCDLATAAMTFWRLRSLAPRRNAGPAIVPARNAVLDAIAAKARAGRFGAPAIAWDGHEAWERTGLIGARSIAGVAVHEDAVVQALAGPFGTERPEPAAHAFLNEPYGEDDIFDSLWRVSPNYAAAADWLLGKPADVWMAAVDDLQPSHPKDVYIWMVAQPECPASVAGQIFWIWDPGTIARLRLEGRSATDDALLTLVLERWRARSLAPSDLDFSRYASGSGYRAVLAQFPGARDPLDVPEDLLAPPQGRSPAAMQMDDDFAWWRVKVDLGSLVPRPRSAAVAEWEKSKEARRRPSSPHVAPAPSIFERIFYGGAFTGERKQIDRCWRQFNFVTILGGLLLIALMRGGMPKAAIWLFFALVAVVSLYQSSARMGGARRILGWWGVVGPVAIGLAMLFRWMDAGPRP